MLVKILCSAIKNISAINRLKPKEIENFVN